MRVIRQMNLTAVVHAAFENMSFLSNSSVATLACCLSRMSRNYSRDILSVRGSVVHSTGHELKMSYLFAVFHRQNYSTQSVCRMGQMDDLSCDRITWASPWLGKLTFMLSWQEFRHRFGKWMTQNCRKCEDLQRSSKTWTLMCHLSIRDRCGDAVSIQGHLILMFSFNYTVRILQTGRQMSVIFSLAWTDCSHCWHCWSFPNNFKIISPCTLFPLVWSSAGCQLVEQM